MALTHCRQQCRVKLFLYFLVVCAIARASTFCFWPCAKETTFADEVLELNFAREISLHQRRLTCVSKRGGQRTVFLVTNCLRRHVEGVSVPTCRNSTAFRALSITHTPFLLLQVFRGFVHHCSPRSSTNAPTTASSEPSQEARAGPSCEALAVNPACPFFNLIRHMHVWP